MPRFPTPWTKKRGQRQLTDPFAGVVGEAAFFAFLFLIGVFGLSLVLIHEFAPHRIAKAPTEHLQSDLSAWVFALVSIAAMVSGATGLLVRVMRESASHERRSVLAARAERLETDAIELVSASGGDDERLPNVPSGTSLNDSPGERLRFRLPGQLPDQGLAGTIVLSLLWNAAWFVLLAVVVDGFITGTPRWIVMMLLVPFGAIGVWSFRRLLSQLRQRAGVGPTIVEIDNHPLTAGGHYQLFISQLGRLRLKRLTVQLVCEEESFYRQGTDLRIERHEAYCEVLHKQSGVTVDPQAPWEQQFSFCLPDNAMHSFVAGHNAIRWRIVVRGESRPWPSFCRSFPVIVHPPDLPPKRSPR